MMRSSFRSLVIVASTIVAMVAASACSPVAHAGERGGAQAARSAVPRSSAHDVAVSNGGDAVTGTISWPDGQPAAGVPIDFYLNGAPYAGGAGGARVITDANGGYSITGCGCSGLVAYFALPSLGDQHADGQHGGNQCNIILQTEPGETWTGVDVEPGSTLNWQMYSMLCDRNYFLPDQLQSVVADLQADPRELSGGTWQDARNRVEGLPDTNPQETGHCAPNQPFDPACPQFN